MENNSAAMEELLDDDDDTDMKEDFEENPGASFQSQIPGVSGRREAIEENESELATPLFENGRYQNPWLPAPRCRMVNCLRQWLRSSSSDSKLPNKRMLNRTLPVMKPDLTAFDTCPISGIRHLWIGHSTSLLQIDGVTILTDPIFSDHCSSVPLGGHKRFRPVPCSISDLPHIDLVLISHNHHDHLDHTSVLALNERYGDSLCWYVPEGLRKWMHEWGCANVVEKTWWQEEVHRDDIDIRVVCTPCQHSSRRKTCDENMILWCSWCVLGPKHSYFFAGDTGYCKVFKQIGKSYGPFTLATIPIGAYSPRSSKLQTNVDPEDAVKLHQDVKSEASIAIHWGTFALTDEPYLEPKELLEIEIEKCDMKSSEFVTVRHGEITLVGSDGYDEVD